MNIEMVVFIDWSVHSFILDYCISFMEKGKHGHHTCILQKYCSVKFLFFSPLFTDSQHDMCTHLPAGIQFLNSLSSLVPRQEVLLNLTSIGMLSF